ncbi:hypothetical protein [Bacteroides sp.]|uniref:hypothetical protein n=1 Tax=Bacteroides sp. TaxID=29523 RepID=UPI003AB2C47C
MKTRLLFATMVLPALFAACTNDEIVDSQSPSLDGRALLDPNFTITVNGEADTRFSWTDDGYKWNDFTANDKFSAGLLDDVNGNIQEKVLTNYVFSTADGSNYTTTSQMMEGVYMFYSYPGFETNPERKPVAFDLTSQVSTDLSKPTDAVNAEKPQLFITPLYKLEKETANKTLGMTFISYWSTAVIPVMNATSESFKIARIVLKTKAEAKKFLVKGTIDPTVMNAQGLIYKYDKDKGTYVLGKNGDKAAEYDDLRVADIAKEGEENRTEVDQLVVNCGSYELAAGKSVTAYIQVPAGSYEKGMKVEVVAEVSKVGDDGKTVTSLKSLETEAEVNWKSDDKQTANNVIRFRRSKATGVFGKAADGTPNAYEVKQIDLDFADAAEGLYANTYNEVYKYVTEATAGSTVIIYNQGSLKVDDSMMALLSKAGKTVRFLNPIEISSDRASASLMNVQFDGGATIKKGVITFGAGVELATEKVLTVEKGATAILGDAVGGAATRTLDNGPAIAGKIVNEGTLKLGGTVGAAIAEVKNGEDAVVEIVGSQTIGKAIDAGVVAKFDTPKTLKVAKDAILTIGDDIDGESGKFTVGYGQSVEVAAGGTITATAAANFVNNGFIENKGTIDFVTNICLVTENDVKKIAKIDNYGAIGTAVNNNTNEDAIIVMKVRDAKINTTVGGGGLVDNTMDGYIKENTGCVIYAEYDGSQNGTLGTQMACTKVIMKNGTWTAPKLPATVVTDLELDGVTLTNGTTRDEITFGGAVTTVKITNSTSEDALEFATTVVEAHLTGSTFEGNVEFKATANLTGDKLVLDNATFNGDLTLAAGTATLNLIGVTFNGGLSAATALTTININPATVGGKTVEAATNFAGVVTATGLTALKIAEKATINLTTTAASIGVAGTTVITNTGYVENRGAVSGASSSTGTTPPNWGGNTFVGS